MKKIIKHIQRWNIWRKRNSNGPLHKFLVLIGFMKSPTMQLTWTPDEIKEIEEAFEKGFEEVFSVQPEWATLYEGVPVNVEEFYPEEEENES